MFSRRTFWTLSFCWILFVKYFFLNIYISVRSNRVIWVNGTMVKIFQKSALLLAKIFHCEFDMIFLFIPQYIRNSHHLRFITSVIEGVGKFNKILYGYPFFFDVKTTFQQVLKTSKRIDHMRFDWKNKLATCLDQFKNRKA